MIVYSGSQKTITRFLDMILHNTPVSENLIYFKKCLIKAILVILSGEYSLKIKLLNENLGPILYTVFTVHVKI
jgi:hypothetical protein